MQVRVLPSTVQVRVVWPLPTCLTVPSPETVATAVLPMLQVGVEEVPLTFTWKACPAYRVKSVRLRDRAPEAPEPLPLEEDAPEVTEL